MTPEERYAAGMERWHRRILEHMRKDVRRIVRETKKRTLARKRAWGFMKNETSLDANADERQIQDVLDIIGRGDEFRIVREKTYSEVKQPTPPKKLVDSSETQQSLDEMTRQVRERRKRTKPSKSRF
jgi:hypothetical protein